MNENISGITINGNTIPMFTIPQGHARFSFYMHDNGTCTFVVHTSDKKIDDTTKADSKDELWENQTVKPVYSILFESVEHIEAYVKAFNTILDCIKAVQD